MLLSLCCNASVLLMGAGISKCTKCLKDSTCVFSTDLNDTVSTNSAHKPNDLPARCYDLLNRLRGTRRNAFRLHWKGSKIPRGAFLDGSPIVWTQHGIVSTEATANSGYYARVEEWSGVNKDEHEMIIATNGEVTAPNQIEMTVEQIRINIPLDLTSQS